MVRIPSPAPSFRSNYKALALPGQRLSRFRAQPENLRFSYLKGLAKSDSCTNRSQHGSLFESSPPLDGSDPMLVLVISKHGSHYEETRDFSPITPFHTFPTEPPY